ncbi:dephospho-CoA kinase [Aquibacillus sediminis]|uniref:dephospho-CoA kinase n=1 Tax=Aquibacillus sediminis TaxID=2574734 RepID=UPI001108063F|nr:dephospho-CoA kinase [Aquibacillus sediminis]
MTVTIGLTGSIATGKSTVASMFKDLDIPVIDADVISRQVVQIGEEAYQEIVATFGENILQEDQSLDRKKLGSIVFADEKKRQQLNQIVHPAVRGRMLELKESYLNKGEPIVVLDIPLLFESKLTYLVDCTIVVYVDEETQLKRLIERDQSSRKEALQRIQSQLSVKEKAALADFVIDNSASLQQTKEQLQTILDQIK